MRANAKSNMNITAVQIAHNKLCILFWRHTVLCQESSVRFPTASLLDLRARKRRHQGWVGSRLQVSVTQAAMLVSSPRVHLQTQPWGRAATETVKQKAVNLARPSHCPGIYMTHVKINKKVRTNLHCQVNEQEASSIIFMAPQYGNTRRKDEIMLPSQGTMSVRIVFVAP